MVRRKRTVRRRERVNAEQVLVAHKLALVHDSMPVEQLPDIDPAEAMQLVINRCAFLLRAAEAEANRLKPGVAKNQSEHDFERWASWDDNGNIIISANYWVVQEEKLRFELAKLTEAAQKIGLSERRTRVAEAQVMALSEALKAVCDKINMPPAMQRQLGAGLREHFDAEAQAVEI